VLFQHAEEIGFTGFLQHHWQDRYHPLKLTLYVALLRAVWHVPDHFAVEGWESRRWRVGARQPGLTPIPLPKPWRCCG
jgi:membrane protease YdiL (CAAX protease family)